MKKVLFTILGLLFLTSFTYAQFTTNASIAAGNSEMVITFAGSVDSLGGDDSTVTSAVFDIEDYDGATNFSIYSNLTSAVSVPKITATLYSSEDNVTYTAGDALLTSDSLETHKWASFTITGRAAFYKLVIANGRLGSASTFNIKLRLPLKETRPGN